MTSPHRLIASAVVAWSALATTGAAAQVSDDVVRIGFITGISGLYGDYDGQGAPKPSGWRWPMSAPAISTKTPNFPK